MPNRIPNMFTRFRGVQSVVYLGVKRLVDVHSVVLALFDKHAPTFPDKSCRRVRVDRAAQKHCLLLVITATHITDGLVYSQDWCVKICRTGEEKETQKISNMTLFFYLFFVTGRNYFSL